MPAEPFIRVLPAGELATPGPCCKQQPLRHQPEHGR